MQVVVALALVSLCSLSPLLPSLDWMPSVLQGVTTTMGVFNPTNIGNIGIDMVAPTNIGGFVGQPGIPTAVTNPPMVVPPIFSVIVVAAAIKAMLLGRYY